MYFCLCFSPRGKSTYMFFLHPLPLSRRLVMVDSPGGVLGPAIASRRWVVPLIIKLKYSE